MKNKIIIEVKGLPNVGKSAFAHYIRKVLNDVGISTPEVIGCDTNQRPYRKTLAILTEIAEENKVDVEIKETQLPKKYHE